MQRTDKLLIPIGCTLVLLVAMAMENYVFRKPPPGADDYHRTIREISQTLPKSFSTPSGEWDGIDQKVQQEAVALLKPNVMFSRLFANETTREALTFLLVQCEETRDMLGHYPPICYKGQGHELAQETPKVFEFDDGLGGKVTINCMVYRFRRRDDSGRNHELEIYNFIMLPTGSTILTNTKLMDYSRNYRRKFFGAGQIQVIFADEIVSRDKRDDMFRKVIQVHMPVIRQILSGSSLAERDQKGATTGAGPKEQVQ